MRQRAAINPLGTVSQSTINLRKSVKVDRETKGEFDQSQKEYTRNVHRFLVLELDVNEKTVTREPNFETSCVRVFQ
jgi:hypothetical protein